MGENKQIYRSPIIRDVPEKDERLIDTGMLHYESSVAGYNERYHRGETSHTIHVWWARRPHSAMRSLVFASLCKDKSAEAITMMAQLAMSCDNELVDRASKVLKTQYNATPRVLDIQLKELVEDGLVKKAIYPELPPRSEYSITSLGLTLIPIIDAMLEWGRKNKDLFEKKYRR